MIRRILTAVLMAGTVSPQTVFRVPVRAVTVPVVVATPDGRFIRELRHADFQLFDNGRPQEFDFDYVDEPVALAVVVQTSDAARAWLPQVRRMRSPVEALIVGRNGQASVITFADGVKRRQAWTRRTDLLDAAFAAMAPTLDDKSQALDAITEAAGDLEQMAAPFRRVILLIAQSSDIASTAKLPEVLSRLERANITLYNVAMPRAGRQLAGKSVRIDSPKGAFAASDSGIMGTADLARIVPDIYRDARTLRHDDPVSVMVAETGGRRIPFRRLREIETAISLIGEELHTEYLLTYMPTHPDPGYHTIRVEVSSPNVGVRFRPGYFILE